MSLQLRRKSLERSLAEFHDTRDLILNKYLKYCKIAKKLLSDENFKSRCIELTEQIISAAQQVELLNKQFSNSESAQLEIEKIELQIEEYKTELKELLQQPYECSWSLLLQPGGLFSKEQGFG